MNLIANKEELEIELAASLCEDEFFFFVREFWEVIIPEEPVYNWHIPVLCAKLQVYLERVMQKKDKNGKLIKRREVKLSDLLINIPPGTTKSTICTVMFPAWAWTKDASLRVMTASYSQSLSTDHAVKSRDIIKSEKYKRYWPDLSIKTDQDNKTHYKNNFGGERYATSVGGTVTGFHAHIIIVDDPLNAKEATSEVSLETAKQFMDTTLSTRKVNKAVTPIILVMQRLHELDPAGNWLKKKDKKIEWICLPARLRKNVHPPELRESYVNGKLDAIRLDEAVLTEAKVDLGEYGYAGQYDQDPAPEDGGIWKKWFIVIEDNLMPDPENTTGFGTDWDLAYTEKELNAASAYVTSGKLDNKMYIYKVGFANKEFPELIAWMKLKPGPHYIEAKASGKSAKQTLTKMGIPAIEVEVKGGDKIARARMATPYAESGMCFIAKSQVEVLYSDSEQGILKFPNSAKLDLADTLAQAIQRQLGKKTRELF